MKTKIFPSITSALFVLTLTGCSSMGNAPAGQSAEEAKAAFESQTPEQKIKILESSPMGADEKKKRIDEVKKAAGMPVDSPEAAVPNGVPATNPPPGGSFPGDPRSAK